MPLLDFSGDVAKRLRKCKTLSDVERLLQDVNPDISRPQRWGIGDGLLNRTPTESADWSMIERREYRAGFAAGKGMR